MPTATKPKPSPDLPARLNTAIREIGDEFFERREEIELLVVADLAGANTFLLGEPGVGKSALIRRTSEIYDGATTGSWLLDRQMPMEIMFGSWDLAEYDRTGVLRRNARGRGAHEVHKPFIDEVGKASATILNALLTFMNEGLYDDGTGLKPINALSIAGASNEELDKAELGAIWDRFMIRKVVNRIREQGNFEKYLLTAVQPKITLTPTTVPLIEFLEARNMLVPQVGLPQVVIDAILAIRAELTAEGIMPSDRRWKQCIRVLQANAFLNGRSDVSEDDLVVLQHVLWDTQKDINKVFTTVMSHTSPLQKMALDLAGQLADILTKVDSLHGQSTADKAKYAAEANHKLKAIRNDLDAAIKEAQDDGRSTTAFDSVYDEADKVQERIFIDCMGMEASRAAQRVQQQSTRP